MDPDIPDLISFNEEASVRSIPIPDSHLIVQDKASCMPPFLLLKYIEETLKINPQDVSILDACAAPGNKSLQLIQYFGKTICVERDEDRCKTLIKRLKKYVGKKNTSKYLVINEDFKNIIENPELGEIEYVLLDASCSGTGNKDIAENYPMLKDALGNCVNEINYIKSFENLKKKLKDKIERLSKFQEDLLVSALSWKSIKGVVYSTCSIFPQEDEDVIKNALKKFPDFKLEELPADIGHQGFIVIL